MDMRQAVCAFAEHAAEELRKERQYCRQITVFVPTMLSAGANPSFIATQMGHSSAQMVYSVYGSWMPESSAGQVALLNEKLTGCVPPMPHSLSVIR
ncbi:DinB/UmuC family translesion DNA polymerase [Pantoea alfalfae]|uniref:DinB/UmuC family translesion DNA polymerase n=1 Tax=Pantoea alfalfae TaxID=3074822 RepID=UPI0035AC0E7F